MRVIGYIDGMNFYEASKDKRWYPAGWCNWTQTLDAYCPGGDISVRYFTTLYSGKAQERMRRQKLHLLAMEKVARAEVVYGACRERQLRCPACKARLKCTCGCDRRFTEKMTDVNIAIRLLEDTIDDLFDRAYLVSADVDLLPAVHAVMRRSRHVQIAVLLPPETEIADEFAKLEAAYPGRSVARHLDLKKMRRFPDDLPSRWGMALPAHWRESAGRRPAKPDPDTPPRRPGCPVPWFEESIGYGTKQVSKTSSPGFQPRRS